VVSSVSCSRRRELEVSPRTLARDLDFLRDVERAPIGYDAQAHGYRLTDVSVRHHIMNSCKKVAVYSFGV
jgi:hypothetical protein